MEIEGNNYAIQTSNKPYQIDPNPYNNDQYFNSNNNRKNIFIETHKRKDNSFDSRIINNNNNNFNFIHKNQDNIYINNIRPITLNNEDDKLFYSKEEYSYLENSLQKAKDEIKKLNEKNKNYEIRLYYGNEENNNYILKINELNEEIEIKNNYIDEITIKENNHELIIQQLNIENGALKQKNDEKEKEINNLKKD